MQKNYKQLSCEQRYQIEALIKAGNSQKTIAHLLEVHPSTICRELKRNTPKAGVGAHEYRARNAQRRTRLRHLEKPKQVLFTNELKDKCRAALKHEKYSPELISAVGRKELGYFPCAETIYKWIWECKHRNLKSHWRDKNLYKLLKHGQRRYKRGLHHDKRGNIPGRVFIEKRDPIVAERTRLGDIEVDLMIGRNHQSAILVTLDRATLKIRLSKLKGKESEGVRRQLIKLYKKQMHWLKTFTFDNDSAFIQHQKVGSALQVDTYFTRPYTSQDKGSVENRIGIIRRFLPKKTDLSIITDQHLKWIEQVINNRPVKKFNFKTPNQVFSEKIALIT